MKASVRLRGIIELISDSKWDEARNEYDIIDSLESEADEVHRDTVEKLSTGVFFAGLGGDLMNLAEKIDGIADSAKDSARTLIFRRLEPSEVLPLKDELCKFLNSCEYAVSSLSEAVRAIGKGREEVIAHVKETEMHEEAADETKTKYLKGFISFRCLFLAQYSSGILYSRQITLLIMLRMLEIFSTSLLLKATTELPCRHFPSYPSFS